MPIFPEMLRKYLPDIYSTYFILIISLLQHNLEGMFSSTFQTSLSKQHSISAIEIRCSSWDILLDILPIFVKNLRFETTVLKLFLNDISDESL